MKKKLITMLLLTSVVFSGCQKTPETTPSDTDESVPDTSVSTTETDRETYATVIPYEEYLDISIINATETPNEVYFQDLRYCRSEDPDYDHRYFRDISRQKIDYIISYLETTDVPDTFRYSGEKLHSPEEYEGHTYLGSVEIAYHLYDKPGPSRSSAGFKYVAIDIFDEFPEGYQEFIDTINEDCGDEQIILNSADREKLGRKAVDEANALLKMAGKKAGLTLADECGDFSGGLVLRRGNIEDNCTVELLIDLCRSEMSSKVAEVLFG